MTKKVLLVDDESSIRSVFQSVLEDAGCEVVEAESGKQAIEILGNNSFDAIVSDARMPNGSGIDLLNWVRTEKGMITPFLLVTGFSDVSLEDAYHLGVDAFLSKPLLAESLQEAVDGLLTPMHVKLAGQQILGDVSLNLVVESPINDIPMQGGLAVGRGGLFVSMENIEVLPHESVNFDILNADKKSLLKGQGIVRWIRRSQKNGLRSGIGIEFFSIEKEYLENFIVFVTKKIPVPFIPRGDL